MKKLFIAAFLLVSVIGFSQNDEIPIPSSVMISPPVFSACESKGTGHLAKTCFQQEMKNHISENLRIPKGVLAGGEKGKANVQFIIEKDGTISNIIVRSIYPEFKEEAQRLIELLPELQPGKHKGKTVRVVHNLMIVFK